MKPLVINLQINVYPDGTVAVSPLQSTEGASCAGAVPLTVVVPSSTSGTKSLPTPASSEVAGPSASGAAGPSGPSESDVRGALVAAVKRSDKATAVGVLESIAGVTRVPDVSAELREAVIAALNAVAPAVANAS